MVIQQQQATQQSTAYLMRIRSLAVLSLLRPLLFLYTAYIYCGPYCFFRLCSPPVAPTVFLYSLARTVAPLVSLYCVALL